MEEEKHKLQATASPSHVRSRANGATIMGLILIIFLGYLMIWIMMPTNVYREHWAIKIHAQTNSTYFGRQGNYFTYFLHLCSCLYIFSVRVCVFSFNVLYDYFIGTRILIFTFPILFIAVLGSVYLHLGMKVGHGSSMIRFLSS